MAVNSNGSFVFPRPVAEGRTYSVTVKTQPTSPSQACTVSNGVGTVGIADVTTVAVTCTTNTHSVGGTITGLTGTGLVLQDNGADDLAVISSGAFAFSTPVPEGGAFAVTVKAQPSSPPQTCTVSNGVGTVGSADVMGVVVVCATANLYLSANDGTNGAQLWRTDGTEAGTRMVAAPTFLGSSPKGFTVWQGAIYYAAQGVGTSAALWRGDGTAEGTEMVKDVAVWADGVAANEISDVGWLTPFNGALYFSAYDNTNGKELWKTDGTTAGTVLVADINPGYGSSRPWGFSELDGALYFCATDGVHGVELWKTDGASGGTVMVKDINPGSGDSCYPYREPTVFNGEMYFQASDGIHGNELWKTDGTLAGTVMLKDINPGIGDSLDLQGVWHAWKLVEFDRALYFQAADGAHGAELWKTDGTPEGTVMVKDISPGSYGSVPGDLTPFDGALYFSANEGSYAAEIWKTDGTAAGTVRVTDIGPSADPRGLTACGGGLYFSAYDSAHGVELWKTDGTSAGTAMVADVFAGVGGSSPAGLIAFGGRVFLTASDGANLGQHGTELWSTDGTPGGTVMVRDIAPGYQSSVPQGLTVY